jgi:hypothetical protein
MMKKKTSGRTTDRSDLPRNIPVVSKLNWSSIRRKAGTNPLIAVETTTAWINMVRMDNRKNRNPEDAATD